MAAESGVVSIHLVLDDRLARPHGVEEVRLVVRHVVVMRGRSIDLILLFDLELSRRRLGMFLAPFIQVLLAQFFRPSIDRIGG